MSMTWPDFSLDFILVFLPPFFFCHQLNLFHRRRRELSTIYHQKNSWCHPFRKATLSFHILSKPLRIVRMMSRPLASTFLTLLLLKLILVYLLPCFWTRWKTCEVHSYSGSCAGSQINRLMLRLLLLRRVSHLQLLHVDTYCIFRVWPVCSDILPCNACTADPCFQKHG